MKKRSKKSKSAASPPPDADWIPNCYRHGAKPVPGVPTILQVNYPRGALPARGFRCPVCGEEKFTAEEVDRMQKLADRLGLYDPVPGRVRKLLRTGGSLAVTLDPELLRDVLGDARAGTPVRVGRSGNRITIEAA